MSKIKAVKSLKLENFSVLPNANFEFSPQLNVIMAENGCGKSHLLKLIYSLLEVTSKKSNNELSKTNLETQFANKLINVFRPDSLGSLVKKAPGIQGIIEQLEENKLNLEIMIEKSQFNNNLDYNKDFSIEDNSFSSKKANIELTLLDGEYSHINFSNKASKKVIIEKSISHSELPIFIPSRELVTLCPWFVSLYLTNRIPLEETWFDTCNLLTTPLLKENKQIKDLLSPIEKAMNGSVLEEQGRFYLRLHHNVRKIEAPLVAEGLRKFVMIARLIATGALLDKGYLFWDEPEANLNPKLIKVAAEIIFALSKQGIQVFIATHSLFLLRELEILQSKEKKFSSRYFSLVASNDGVKLEQGDNMHSLDTIVALDENLAQSDRYLDI